MKKGIIIVIVVIVFLLFLTRVFPLLLFSYTNTWKYTAEYEEYVEEFNAIKDYILESYQGEEDKYLSVSYTVDKNIRLYDADEGKYLESPEDVNEALEAIFREGFPNKDSSLDVIRIHNNRISFCITNGNYCLTYSPDEKPSWINGPEEERHIWTRNLENYWYHVVEAPY
ncbi:MAG: hypothetical protein E7283_05815 [Lachnospiraceae bacterium]|nr:hypothetical protein [Lachnospiraceae bacterium]